MLYRLDMTYTSAKSASDENEETPVNFSQSVGTIGVGSQEAEASISRTYRH